MFNYNYKIFPLIKYIMNLTILFSLIILLTSCKENDTIISEEVGNGMISGIAKYLDNSVAAFARIELQSVSSGRSIYTYCDSVGKFSFSSLQEGAYNVIFRSTNYDISTSYSLVNLSKDQSVTKDIYIRYNMLDDFATRQINDNFFLIKFQPNGAKLGNNFSLVDHLSGYYRTNLSDSVTLSAQVFKVPDNLNWNDINLNPDSIPSEFEFLFEVNDEVTFNGTHEIQISGDNISKIFSNPPNGFAFIVKKDSLNVKLKIPCVDFNNNDFGLKIIYK